MKNLLRLTGSAAVLLGATLPAQAQRPALFRPGYVVLAAAPTDTLRGDVDLYQTNRAQPQVVFRAAAGPAHTYGLAELTAAGDHTGLLFRRCLVPKGDATVPALLQVLVAGPASLYRDPTDQLPATYYVEKPGHAPLPLKKSQFAQVLPGFFADCPTVNTQVVYAGQYVYSTETLRWYVVNYNRCLYPAARLQFQAADAVQAAGPTKRYSPVDPERARWAVQVGAAQLKMDYYSSPFREQGPLTLTLGVLASLPLTDYFSIVTGLTHSSLRADQHRTQLIGAGRGYAEVQFRSRGSIVRCPLTARFTLRRPESRWRPYLQAGMQMNYLLNTSVKRDLVFHDPAVPTERTNLSVDGLAGGLQGEAGVLFRYGRHWLGAGACFQQNNVLPVQGRLDLIDYTQVSAALTYYH